MKTSQDITGQKRAEKELARLASFPELNPSPVVEITAAGEPIYLNPAAKTLFPDLEKSKGRHPLLAGLESTVRDIRESDGRSGIREVRIGEKCYQQTVYLVPGSDLARVYTVDVSGLKQAEEVIRENEERFRRLAEGVSFIPWEADASTWRFTYVGPRVIEVLGYPLADWYEDGFWAEHIHPEDRERALTFCAEASTSRQHYEFEYRMVSSDGRIVWLEDFVHVSGDEPKRLQGFMLDITERKQAEEALRKWEQVFHHAGWGVAIANPVDNTLQAVNPAFARMHGYTVEELLHKPLADTFAPESRDEMPAHARIAHEKGHHTYESVHLRKDGARFPVLTDVTVVKDEEGNILYRAANCQDMTEHKQAEEALRASEERFRGIFNQTISGIAQTDLTGQFVLVNQKYCEIVGYTREELLSLRMQDITHPDDVPENVELFERLVREGEGFELEKRYVRKDGSIVWVRNAVSAVRDRSDEPIYVVAVVEDITERKRATDRLRILAEASRSFAEAGTDYRRLLDTVARTVAENFGDRCGVWFVSDDEQWIEPVAFHHPDPETLALLREWMSDPMQVGKGVSGKAARTGEPVLLPVITPERLYAMTQPEHRSHIERIVIHGMIAVPLRARGRVFGSISIGRDRPGRPYTEGDRELLEDLAGRAAFAIDNALLYQSTREESEERRCAEEEVRVLNEELEQRVRTRTVQLEEANKELEAFSYSVSHDLRAPLRHVSGFARMLRKRAAPALDETGRRHLDVIVGSADHAGELIDSLLAFFHMGRAEMRRANVDMNRLVREALDGTKFQTDGRSIDWKIGELPEVVGDHSMLRLVMDNLLSNAVKYTRARDEAVIEVGSERNGEDETVFFVRDNGVGFDMKYLDKLFDVFQRLHGAEEYEGTGIGLANVRRIVQRHGGRVWAEGAVGVGATFHFSLPQSQKTSDEELR